jgi:hypothetical protein
MKTYDITHAHGYRMKVRVDLEKLEPYIKKYIENNWLDFDEDKECVYDINLFLQVFANDIFNFFRFQDKRNIIAHFNESDMGVKIETEFGLELVATSLPKINAGEFKVQEAKG